MKKVTIYTKSQLMIDYCKKNKVDYVECEDIEEMMHSYYASLGLDYEHMQDINAIANLSDAVSQKDGKTGFLWTNILFDCKSTGQDDSELQRRYSVVALCKEKPPKNVQDFLSIDDIGTYTRERCRALVAAFTQFYPLCTQQMTRANNTEVYKISMCDYNLYLYTNVFESSKEYPKWSEASNKENRHLALLEDVKTRRIIHKFKCNKYIFAIVRNLSVQCTLDNAPTGVMLHANSLPVLDFKYRSKDVEKQQLISNLFMSLLIVAYSTPKEKQKLVGIDLHTGNLVTAKYYVDSFSTYDLVKEPCHSGIRKIMLMKTHKEDEHLTECFAKDCYYNMKK